jgi:hypothetical protein
MKNNLFFCFAFDITETSEWKKFNCSLKIYGDKE